jgi:hypothetical protein
MRHYTKNELISENRLRFKESCLLCAQKKRAYINARLYQLANALLLKVSAPTVVFNVTLNS